MAKKRNNKIKVKTISTMEQFNLQKPRYNPYATGHGAWGTKGYNRTKDKARYKKQMQSY